nr:metallophosphoesterase [uncultured Methanoregula sp.]
MKKDEKKISERIFNVLSRFGPSEKESVDLNANKKDNMKKQENNPKIEKKIPVLNPSIDKSTSNLSKSSPNTRSKKLDDNYHPSLKIRYTLSGYNSKAVYRMAFSPDGEILATSSEEGFVNLFDTKNGKLLRSLKHNTPIVCVAWSPDGNILATGSHDVDRSVYTWNPNTGQLLHTLKKHKSGIMDVAWSPDGTLLASCSNDGTIFLWGSNTGQLVCELKAHTRQIFSLSWSPDGRCLCSGSWDDTFCVWDVSTSNLIQTFKGNSKVNCIAWSPDNRFVALASSDQVVHIWDIKDGREKYVLEGHTADVISVSFFDNGHLLASLSEKGQVIFWETNNWSEVMNVSKIGDTTLLANLAVHPTLPIIAAPGNVNLEVNLFDVDTKMLRRIEHGTPTVYYVNAKAVLVGDSSVGKSGLGIRIAEGKYRTTDSTHGAQFWHFPTEKLPDLPKYFQAELTLWDLAGQPEYRLTHQLFLDDTDLALLLFDCSDSNDPFHGVPYWAKALKKQAPHHAKKYLVSARCDVSPVTVNRREINHVLADFGLDDYFKTSAKTGEGVDFLFQRMLKDIPWDKIPRTSTPKLFQIVREFLLELKAAGKTIISMDEILLAARDRFTERLAIQEELDTVIQLLQSRGLVHRLNPKPSLNIVLLKPELINQYGSSIIQAALNHPLDIGAVPERDVLTGNVPFSGFNRLPQSEEVLVLESTAELLIKHDLCFREMGYLVFPSQIKITRLPPTNAHPRTEVAYRFSGSIETIYASLVVRLSYTNYFHREDQWKYAVEFSIKGDRLGFSMQQITEGTGELEIYFHPNISENDRVLFIRFITDHLYNKGVDIHEQIRLYCPKCSKEVINHDAIEIRVQYGYLDIPCQYCGTAILIPKSIEERYRREPTIGEINQELIETAEKRTNIEIEQFRLDQRQYLQVEDSKIHILHLSDLHIDDENQANKYRVQLESDLINELKIKRIEYLIISGDITSHSSEKEFKAAFGMVNDLVKRFGLDPSRVIIVPGNHDLNWDASESAYLFVTKRKLPDPLPQDRFIPAGDAGVLLRDEELYPERFTNFNNHFYRRIYCGKEFPRDYSSQALLIENAEDHILFLGLNSSWQIDHHFHDRANINMDALTIILDKLNEGVYNGWLKIAVWHHPISGREMMNDEFMQLLTVHNFQICLHGHIHEAIENFHKYDDNRGIFIVGAGTFGAPVREQTSGIPLQYNLLAFNTKKSEITVYTRKKEKPNGAWSADSRWGDKNDPKSWYRIQIKNYLSHK